VVVTGDADDLRKLPPDHAIARHELGTINHTMSRSAASELSA